MAELKRTTHPRKPGAPASLVAKVDAAPARSLAALAAMGGGEVAYVRAFRAGDLRAIFPQTAELHPSVQLFALFGADGTPLMLADSRDAVISGAWQNDLAMAMVH